MKILQQLFKKKLEYTTCMYGGLDVRVFPNKCLYFRLLNNGFVNFGAYITLSLILLKEINLYNARTQNNGNVK